jgi:hypothetical protein
MSNKEYNDWRGYFMWKWEKQGLFKHEKRV